MRIANGATAAEVTLQSEAGVGVLRLTAKNAGLIGETIRAVTTYNGQQPEVTFNLEIFRWETVGSQLVKQDRELWSNLSMDPLAPRYAPIYLTQNSTLVDAAAAATVPVPGSGFSQSGRPVPFDSGTPTTFRAAWTTILGNGVGPPDGICSAASSLRDASTMMSLHRYEQMLVTRRRTQTDGRGQRNDRPPQTPRRWRATASASASTAHPTSISI